MSHAGLRTRRACPLRGRRHQALRGDLRQGRHRRLRLPHRRGRRAAPGLRPAGRDGPGHLRQRAGRLGARGPDQRPVPRRLAAEPGGGQAPLGVLAVVLGVQQPLPDLAPRPAVLGARARSPTCATRRSTPSSSRSWPSARRRCSPRSPQAGRDPRFLAMAALRDIELLERGVKMRTLYQHSARRSSVTHKYVAAVTARGAEVRTLDEFFNRMIVIDRRVAVIPNQEDLSRRGRDPRAGRGRLPRRRLRALLGAGPGLHQPGDLADEGHRRRAARDDDADAHRGPQRPGERQAARASARAPTPATSPTSRPSTTRRRASSSATRWAGWASRATRTIEDEPTE